MPGSDALCRERRAGQGADTPAMVTFASAPFPQGRPRFLAGRWPCGTGLTSYLSGCFCFCSGVTRFFTPPHQERLRALPDSFVPRDIVSFARPVLRKTWAFWRGGPAGKRHRVLVLP